MDPETGTMIRSGVSAVVNPLDLYAIELAVQLKKNSGGTITAVSMGPPDAVRAIREAVAMGCDEGVLLSDKRFGGADTWATSYTLAKAIEKIGSYDLLIFGERATDGDTGQVGPECAAWLDLPLLTYVARVDKITESAVEVERLIENGYQKVRAPLPAVLTVVKEIAWPQLPTLGGKKRARLLEIPTWGKDEIGAEDTSIGLKGSPTRVVKIETPKVTRNGSLIDATDEDGVDRAVDALVAYLAEIEVI